MMLKMLFYLFIGLGIEVFINGLLTACNTRNYKADRLKAKGYVSLWMVPIYGLLLPLVFEPLYVLLTSSGQDVSFYVRYMIYGVSFTVIEALWCFIIHKSVGILPWNYSMDRFRVFESGYTKYYMPIIFGFYGLFLELFADILKVL